MIELDGMLSVIMPAYNEEKLIYSSIMKTLDIVSSFVKDIEIVAVNDGKKLQECCKKDNSCCTYDGHNYMYSVWIHGCHKG